jgi:hypothetical protein
MVAKLVMRLLATAVLKHTLAHPTKYTKKQYIKWLGTVDPCCGI